MTFSSASDTLDYYRVKVAGLVNVLEAMVRHGVRTIVFSSSCATYGVPARLPIAESAPRCPINPHGRSKLACNPCHIAHPSDVLSASFPERKLPWYNAVQHRDFLSGQGVRTGAGCLSSKDFELSLLTALGRIREAFDNGVTRLEHCLKTQWAIRGYGLTQWASLLNFF
jgi:hypothetical protein